MASGVSIRGRIASGGRVYRYSCAITTMYLSLNLSLNPPATMIQCRPTSSLHLLFYFKRFLFITTLLMAASFRCVHCNLAHSRSSGDCFVDKTHHVMAFDRKL